MDVNIDTKQIVTVSLSELEETTGAVMDVLDGEWPWLSQAVMDWSSWPDPEMTTLETVDD